MSLLPTHTTAFPSGSSLSYNMAYTQPTGPITHRDRCSVDSTHTQLSLSALASATNTQLRLQLLLLLTPTQSTSIHQLPKYSP